MPLFLFSAADQGGKTVKGEREAENEKTLAAALKGEGLFLLEAKEKGDGLHTLFSTKVSVGEFFSRIRPVSLVEKMFFTRNLGVMISAGLALTKALEALIQQTPNAKLRRILEDISQSVVKGRSLAESLKSHEVVFGALFINMIEVGETTGKLSLVLKLLARQMKKDYDLKRRVKGAMLYPAIIISALVIIGTLMMVYVVPTLTGTIKELGVELPITTRIIILVSDALVKYLLWVLLIFVVFLAAVWRFLKTPRGRRIFDKIVLRLPLFGDLIKKFNSARFSRTLSYLITAGVPIVKSLEIVSKVLGNTLYREAIEFSAKDIQKGRPLNEILVNYPNLFQPVVIQMVKVGEETGKVSSLLLRIALFFEEDVNETTKNLSTIIEPILMIVIGAAVGFFAISMLQPIYSGLGSI